MQTPLMHMLDGYKLVHRMQYPEGTEYVYVNWTPRSSRNGDKELVVFGIQSLIDRWFVKGFQEFLETPRALAVAQYEEMLTNYLGPDNGIGSDHIGALHDLGYLPLEIRALPEGTVVPIGVPVLTMMNTHPDFFWLPNYFETLLSSELWLMSTSATTAWKYRKLFNHYAELTGAPMEMVQFQGHDFSMRGMQGVDAAARSGAGHLLSFAGTDTVPALGFIREYYGGYENGYLVGTSVPATEHSVMCAGGEENEMETFERLLRIHPSGILSVVSDTWDLWNVLTEILPALKEKIMARPGTLVIRPDSGDPVKIMCGDPDADPDSPQFKGVIELLWDVFGGTINEKGFKVLDSHIGAIYGDSITLERATAILDGFVKKGFVSSSSVFGIGSFTYTYVTRDTYGFAMKATWVKIKGVAHAIFKRPVTDDGGKTSARGLLAVRRNETTGELELHQDQNENGMRHSMLRLLWKNGNYETRESFKRIRERLAVQA